MHIHDYLLLAKNSAAAATSSGGKGMSLEWAIVIFMTLLGVAVTLMPPKRTSEIKRPKEE